jgi:hypothetical protein
MGNDGVYASDAKYGTPWIATDTNLNSLIKEGYTIVGSSLTVVELSGNVIEVIYLQKKEKLYRCFTTESKGKTGHMCEYLTEPKKIAGPKKTK